MLTDTLSLPMSSDPRPNLIHLEDFAVNKQIKFFQALRQKRFSGKLTFSNTLKTKWSFFMAKGNVIYVTGGKHPVRRWRRNLVLFLPQIASRLSEEVKKIDLMAESQIWISWDYHLLHMWFQKQKIDLDEINAYIGALVEEVLFDLAQAGTISFKLTECTKMVFRPMTMIDPEQPILKTRKLWARWQELNFQDISPNSAPNILDRDRLKASSTEKKFLASTKLLDGQVSIRDLAIKKQSDTLNTMRLLAKTFPSTEIEFKEISDLPYPLVIPNSQAMFKARSQQDQTKVACISQNKIMSQQLLKITETLNYALLNIVDYIPAVGVLIEEEPDFIMIDLELPESSSYDICNQLRKINHLHHIPIVLFGRKIGLAERIKSKLVGASEVFEHSMNIISVLRLVERYRILSTIGSTNAT